MEVNSTYGSVNHVVVDNAVFPLDLPDQAHFLNLLEAKKKAVSLLLQRSAPAKKRACKEAFAVLWSGARNRGGLGECNSYSV